MREIDEMKIRQLDGTLLLVLRELLRHRKTTEAARRLGLSQSAVSHALRRLRELFGDRLFIRRPHGLEPTRHALALAPRIEDLIEAANGLLGSAANFDAATSTRSFRIAAPEFLTALLAGPMLEMFAELAPRSRFGFAPLLGEEALRALRRDEIDLAVGRFAGKPDELHVESLLKDRYCLVARRGHPIVRGTIGRTQLQSLQHVMVSVAGDFRSPMDTEFQALGIDRQIVASVPRFLNAFLVVAASDAVAVAPQALAHAHARALGLQVRPLTVRLRPIRIIAVRHPRADPGTEWLCGLVQDAVQHAG